MMAGKRSGKKPTMANNYGKSGGYTHVAPISMAIGMLKKKNRIKIKELIQKTELDISKNVYVVDNPKLYCGKCKEKFKPFDFAYIIFGAKPDGSRTFKTVRCLSCSPLKEDPEKVDYYEV